MLGRAGRPQFDDSGVAVIMTSAGQRERYAALADGAEPVESSLGAGLSEHLAAEVCLGTVTSAGTALGWLRSTFWAIRAAANPAHYRLPRAAGPDAVAALLRNAALASLMGLWRVGAVRFHRVLRDGGGGSDEGGGGGGGGAPDPDARVHHYRGDVFVPASLDDLQRECDVRRGGPGDVHVSPLTPAHVLSRHYLRFATLALFPTIREWRGVSGTISEGIRARLLASSLPTNTPTASSTTHLPFLPYYRYCSARGDPGGRAGHAVPGARGRGGAGAAPRGAQGEGVLERWRQRCIDRRLQPAVPHTRQSSHLSASPRHPSTTRPRCSHCAR
jgi:hypothetical protein